MEFGQQVELEDAESDNQDADIELEFENYDDCQEINFGENQENS